MSGGRSGRVAARHPRVPSQRPRTRSAGWSAPPSVRAWRAPARSAVFTVWGGSRPGMAGAARWSRRCRRPADTAP